MTFRQMIFKVRMRNVRFDWPINESFDARPSGWPGWPGGKEFAVVITHDVESARGLKKCRALAETDLKFKFKSSFNIVPYKYIVPATIRWWLQNNGLEVGVHDYNHDGKLYKSRKIFDKRASEINKILNLWNVVGFRSAAMHHNLDWISNFDIQYDCSTFDSDPFEPQPDGVHTIYPYWYQRKGSKKGFVEIPYTLPQDFTLFIIKKEKDCRIWKEKLDWIVERGGMAAVIVHPDYINFDKNKKNNFDEYSCELYEEFLEYIKTRYEGRFWNPLPKELASFVKSNYASNTENLDDSCLTVVNQL